MTRVATAQHFEVDGLLCRREVLGESVTIKRNGFAIRIELPEAPDAFKFTHGSISHAGPENARDPRDYDPTVAIVDRGSRDLVEVRLIRVVINSDAALSAAGFDTDNAEHCRLEDAVLRAHADEGLQIAREICERVSLTLGQVIEPSGRYPRLVSGLQLLDLDAGLKFPHMIVPGGEFNVVGEEEVLTSERLRDVAARITQLGPPTAEDLLLVEANALIHSHQVSAPERATLLSAMAVEFCTKRTLRILAEQSGQDDLLDLLLNHPRDWSMSAHGLLQKALPVLKGEQLGLEHAAIAKSVQPLFEARNKVVHKGEAVEKAKAETYVSTARRAVSYMHDLVSISADAGAEESTGGTPEI